MQSRSPIFLAIVLVLCGLSVWAYFQRDYSLGLDVQGGVRLTYQIDQASLKPDQRTRIPEIQNDLVRILGNRAGAGLNVVESSVSKKGLDQIIVELPGYTDITKAKEVFSSTARIQVYHARNVSNPVREGIYETAGNETVNGAPQVSFARRSRPDEVFKPGDEGYKRMIEDWDLILEGPDVQNAYVSQMGTATVPHFDFSPEGARKMERFSRRFFNQQANIAFVLDGAVLSIAPIERGTILSTNAFINGQFEPSYVRQLTDLVKAGALPVDLTELSSLKVDPTIGTRALRDMVTAGLISFAIVIAFLVVYYGFPGVVASVAMMMYALFTIVVLKYINATFSLAAIAALILSIAMAVDANILIFERLKEEVRGGKTLSTAISLAFRRALEAIIDSNAATIGTSIVLWYFGEGAVRGFATTLIIGVAISFFTAVAVTRALISGLTAMGIGTNPKWYALDRNWFGEKLEQRAETNPLNIIGKSKLYFMISAGIMVFGLIFVPFGIKFNVEFQGGKEAIYQVPMNTQVSSGQVIERLKAGGIEKANVKFGEGQNEQGQPTRLVFITIPPGSGVEANDPQALQKVATAAQLPSEGGSIQEIGPTIRAEMVRNAILGIVFSSLIIIFWLAIRFGVALGGLKNGLKFGISAIIAMLHDVVVVIGVAGIVGAFLGWEISSLFITAMLTVASFSVHDTIVIFDRIRENLRRPHKGQTFEFLVNKSITQSIARSINTSMTAIVTLILLIAIGTPTPELKFMCVTMLAGLVVGTYSSIFNASPILHLWDQSVVKKKGVEGGLMAESEVEMKLRAAGPRPVNEIGAMPVEAAPTGGASKYGTIKRRSSVASKATKPIDEEEA